MPRFNMNLYKKKPIPFEKDFGHNEELRRRIFENIEPELKAQGYTYTEEEKNKIINNQEKLDLFNKSMVVSDRIESQIAIMNEFVKQYKVPLITPFTRVGYSLIKLPSENATKEEIERIHKENLNTYLKYSDPRNVEKLCEEVVDYCVNYDVTKYSNLNTTKAIDLYLEDDRINYLFCIDSMLTTTAGPGFSITDQLSNTIEKIKGCIEDGSNVQTECVLSASAMNFLLPENPSIETSTMLLMTLADKANQYVEDGISGFVFHAGSERGLQEYNNKACAEPKVESEKYEKYKNDLFKKYGKDFLLKYDYDGKSISLDIKKLVRVENALEAYELMKQPNLTPEQKEQYETMWNTGKDTVGLKKEKDTAIVKSALEEYKKNFKQNFVKRSENEIYNTFARVFKTDNFAEIMANEREDFRVQKRNGATTLASEIQKLSAKNVKKEDTADLLRVYGEVKTRISSRHWYSYMAFWNIRKQNNQLRTIEAKITESGNRVDLFQKAYINLKNIDMLEKVRATEHLPGPNYIGREVFNQKYTVQSERIENANIAAKIVNEKLIEKDIDLMVDNQNSTKHMEEIDNQLQKMYEEDPELKELVEHGVKKTNVVIDNKEIENNEVNNDINTNENTQELDQSMELNK